MQLYEWEAKGLVAQWGVPVPRGTRWPALPVFAEGDRPLVAKAQTVEGRRGLRGGIIFCDRSEDVASAVSRLEGMSIGGEVVREVYVEERLAIQRELYVAFAIDRDRACATVMLGSSGGVDVERHAGTVATIALAPALGLRPYVVRELVRAAGLEPGLVARLGPVLASMWDCFEGEEAELLEVNPLVETADGALVAADARVILDDNAAFRHPKRPTGGTAETAFEQRCSQLGAVGVELGGTVAAIVSGAGLMMATIDLVVSGGGSVRAAVDLGGLVLREADELADLVDAVAELRPAALLINASFQLATCDALARKLAVGFERRPPDFPVIARLRGRGLDEARTILGPYGVEFAADLEQACARVVAKGRGQSPGRDDVAIGSSVHPHARPI